MSRRDSASLIRAGVFQLAGSASGPGLVLSQELSFWGGVDVDTGVVIDRSHPDFGTSLAGAILVMPGGRGSSSSSSVLAEAIRKGTAPAGILIERPDPILAIGAIVADFLYGIRMPLVVCDTSGVVSGDRIVIAAEEGAQARISILKTYEGEA